MKDSNWDTLEAIRYIINNEGLYIDIVLNCNCPQTIFTNFYNMFDVNYDIKNINLNDINWENVNNSILEARENENV